MLKCWTVGKCLANTAYGLLLPLEEARWGAVGENAAAIGDEAHVRAESREEDSPQWQACVMPGFLGSH